jgi:hypothetical protein
MMPSQAAASCAAAPLVRCCAARARAAAHGNTCAPHAARAPHAALPRALPCSAAAPAAAAWRGGAAASPPRARRLQRGRVCAMADMQVRLSPRLCSFLVPVARC